MTKFNFKNKILTGGFTLLEALVATSILMVAVAAPITIAQKGLSSAVYSKNQLIASYLAQDVIEYIKNKRDENVLNNRDWLSGFNFCLGENNYCAIDTKSAGGDGEIFEDESILIKKEIDDSGNFKFYGYDLLDVDTNFTRKVNLKLSEQTAPSIASGAEASVTATVSWNGGEVVVKTLIYNY